MVTADTISAAAALLDGALVDVSSLDNAALVDLQRALGVLTHTTARHAAVAAGELARRSTHELGYAGLAQTSGHRTPEALIQAVTGVTAPEAARLVRVGSLPLTSPLATAVAAGVTSVDAADAIRRGLGDPDAATSAQSLDEAAQRLTANARSSTPEQLYRAARDARDALDQAGIARREQERRDLRYLRVRQRDDGMVTGSFALDQEDGTVLLQAIDAILSPRRGGPRFTCESERADAAALIADPRTNDQLAADAFADLIRLAVDADPGTLLGDRRPGVRVVVTAEQLTTGVGSARIEGCPEAISIRTAQRHACSAGVVGVLFDSEGRALDVGRTQRLFTARQRVALAVRDGGCLIDQCARPPSHCEAHHINHWHRDRGSTDVDDGVLLCRHHHMLIHNNGWEITRERTQYWLVPPRTVDPARVPVRLRSKNPTLRELVSAEA